MCVLCRDTFSRSDILKRHFQKCCIRRGNPTGISHLSHPQAHVKKHAAAQQQQQLGQQPGQPGQHVQQQGQAPSQQGQPGQHQPQSAPKPPGGMGGDGDHLHGLSSLQSEGIHYGFPVSDSINNLQGDQSQLSRTNSLGRLENGGAAGQDRAGSLGAASRSGSFGGGYGGGGDLPQQMPGYSMPPSNQNGMPMYGGDSNSSHAPGMEWAQMFQSGAQHQAYAPTSHSSRAFDPNVSQSQIATKTDPRFEAKRAEGALGANSTEPQFLLFATLAPASRASTSPTEHDDPYARISARIVDFLTPTSTSVAASTHDPRPAEAASAAGRQQNGAYHKDIRMATWLGDLFSPGHVRHFLDQYIHFHVHFPFLHTPTFRVMEAHPSLIAGICCIGACYADIVSADAVRHVVDMLHSALAASSMLLNDSQPSRPPASRQDIEELQALVLLISLLVWNGSPSQRSQGRQLWPSLAHRSRQLGLFNVPADAANMSPLHRPDLNPASVSPAMFDWPSWVHQEERARTVHMVLLYDSAMGLYFNMPSQVNCFEILAPLPADDAAWDAPSARECTEALGLLGAHAAQASNPDGTQRPMQPYGNHVLQALLHGSYDIQPGTTNLFGKFIIIHAILALIRQAQIDGSNATMGYGTPPPSDCITNKGAASAPNSGRGTPVNDAGNLVLAHHTMRQLLTTLEKFKSNWDVDMARQFPPPTTNHPRRHGFSKDGVHFYWLAKLLLKNTRPAHLQLPADQRFTQVMQMLQAVKTWVMSDAAARGEELGSVGDIDADYAVHNLTVHLAGLFKPLSGLGAKSELGARTEVRV